MKPAAFSRENESLHHFEGATSVASVDSEKGVIYGVSLITAGIAARGHSIDHPADKDEPEALRRKINLEIDDTTLEQMLSCAEAKKKVPVKWNHKTGADAVSGYLKNFRIEGKKLVGDWHLLKSHERYQHALELATVMPESLGLSTSFRGKDEFSGGRAFARCTDLVSADLVASPAANPDGFFEEGSGAVDRGMKGMAKPTNADGAAHELAENEPSLAALMAGINALTQGFSQVNDRLSQFEEAHNSLVSSLTDFGAEEEEEEVEFANGDDALQFLSEKLSSIEDAKEQARVERAFSVYENKVETLLELNEQLALENQVMAEAITELSAKTGARVEFSAAPDGGGYEHSLSVPSAGGNRHAPRTEFEARCRHFESEGKDQHEAMRLAITEDRSRYNTHLQEIGVMARDL